MAEEAERIRLQKSLQSPPGSTRRTWRVPMSSERMGDDWIREGTVGGEVSSGVRGEGSDVVEERKDGNRRSQKFPSGIAAREYYGEKTEAL